MPEPIGISLLRDRAERKSESYGLPVRNEYDQFVVGGPLSYESPEGQLDVLYDMMPWRAWDRMVEASKPVLSENLLGGASANIADPYGVALNAGELMGWGALDIPAAAVGTYRHAVKPAAQKTAELLEILGEQAGQTGMRNQIGAILHHGSPHQFNRIDQSKMGTGEGAQAYGWGTYLAESPEVAGEYAIKGQQGIGSISRYHGQELPDEAWDQIAPIMQKYGIPGDISPNQTQAGMVREILDNYGEKLTPAETSILEVYAQPKGNIYSIEVSDEKIAQMLDWDAPLSKQPVAVQNAIRERYTGPVADFYLPEMQGKTGREIYSQLASEAGSDQAASMLLREHGIPGIKYYDGESRMAVANEVYYPDQLGKMTDDELRAEAYDVLGIDPEDISADDLDDWVISDLIAADKQGTMSRVPYQEGSRTRNIVSFDENDMTVLTRNGESVRGPDWGPIETPTAEAIADLERAEAARRNQAHLDPMTNPENLDPLDPNWAPLDKL